MQARERERDKGSRDEEIRGRQRLRSRCLSLCLACNAGRKEENAWTDLSSSRLGFLEEAILSDLRDFQLVMPLHLLELQEPQPLLLLLDVGTELLTLDPIAASTSAAGAAGAAAVVLVATPERIRAVVIVMAIHQHVIVVVQAIDGLRRIGGRDVAVASRWLFSVNQSLR